MSLKERILNASSYIKNQIKEPIEIGIVLGSGLALLPIKLKKRF